MLRDAFASLRELAVLTGVGRGKKDHLAALRQTAHVVSGRRDRIASHRRILLL
jgi:hypothetical protein